MLNYIFAKHEHKFQDVETKESMNTKTMDQEQITHTEQGKILLISFIKEGTHVMLFLAASASEAEVKCKIRQSPSK